jgi:Uma2 family endonuclease
MATRSMIRQGMTLEEFLAWPRIDEKPYLEYQDGRIEVKVSPQRKHGVIEKMMTRTLDELAVPLGLGEAYPELRCTFAGRSILADVVFLLADKLHPDENGEISDEVITSPDIPVEIRSPDQTVKKTKEKLVHSVANGCPLGWYIDPYRRIVEEYRPGQTPRTLKESDILDGDPVLPGFRLPVVEVFGWLVYRVQRPDNTGAEDR